MVLRRKYCWLTKENEKKVYTVAYQLKFMYITSFLMIVMKRFQKMLLLHKYCKSLLPYLAVGTCITCWSCVGGKTCCITVQTAPVKYIWQKKRQQSQKNKTLSVILRVDKWVKPSLHKRLNTSCLNVLSANLFVNYPFTLQVHITKFI